MAVKRWDELMSKSSCVCVLMRSSTRTLLGLGERRDPESVVAQVKRLKNVELAVDERSGKGEVRREALYAMSAAIDPAEARNGIFEEPLPFITAAARGDFNDTA